MQHVTFKGTEVLSLSPLPPSSFCAFFWYKLSEMGICFASLPSVALVGNVRSLVMIKGIKITLL